MFCSSVMENQPQKPEFRNNPENFYSCKGSTNICNQSIVWFLITYQLTKPHPLTQQQLYLQPLLLPLSFSVSSSTLDDDSGVLGSSDGTLSKTSTVCENRYSIPVFYPENQNILLISF